MCIHHLPGDDNSFMVLVCILGLFIGMAVTRVWERVTSDHQCSIAYHEGGGNYSELSRVHMVETQSKSLQMNSFMHAKGISGL